MNFLQNELEAARNARRWQAKVREAEAELIHRIAFIETRSGRMRDRINNTSTLTRLRQRLSRIIDRYGSILN